MADVKVYGFWASPFSKRVEVALKAKGVDYEYIEENLVNKSEELIKYNPTHKKIPVLVHNGKPIAESLIILEYIDETWKYNPILPNDPYDRAQSRFWAKFIDEKILPAAQQAFLIQGDQTQKASEELLEHLTILDSYIKKNNRNGGNTISYMDIVGLYGIYWIPILQEFREKDVFTEEKFPGLFEWVDQLLNIPILKDNLPDKDTLLSFTKARFAPATIAPK